MAKAFRYTQTRRFVDKLMRSLIRLGIAPKHYYLLTVPGRKSGRLHSLPVALIEEGEQRWLVAPYGLVNWVHNARAAGQVVFSRGRQSEMVRIVELGAEESAPILQKYLARYSVFAQPFLTRHRTSLLKRSSRRPHTTRFFLFRPLADPVIGRLFISGGRMSIHNRLSALLDKLKAAFALDHDVPLVAATIEYGGLPYRVEANAYQIRITRLPDGEPRRFSTDQDAEHHELARVVFDGFEWDLNALTALIDIYERGFMTGHDQLTRCVVAHPTLHCISQ